ncbi:Uncharacterised protein [uncultured archaeon]|nr:Uncharacterised protein [uncultured archaeon]
MTVTRGWSTLVGKDEKLASRLLYQIARGTYKKGKPVEKWDGKAGTRIAAVLAKIKPRA